jgi:hypothetical protein
MNFSPAIILKPHLEKLDILGQLTPGYIILIDPISRAWKLEVPLHSVISGLSKLKHLVTTFQWPQAQRDQFYSSLFESVSLLGGWALMTTEQAVFERGCNDKGKLCEHVVETLSPLERDKVEDIVNLLQLIVRHCGFVKKGIGVLKTSLPYKGDVSFFSKVALDVVNPLKLWMDKIKSKLTEPYVERIFHMDGDSDEKDTTSNPGSGSQPSANGNSKSAEEKEK